MLSGIFRQEAERQKINNKVIKFHFILPPEKAKTLLKPYTEMILAFQSRSQSQGRGQPYNELVSVLFLTLL